MNIDVFPHILPKKYFDRLLAVAPPELALQKRMSVIPVLVNLELRLTMSTVGPLEPAGVSVDLRPHGGATAADLAPTRPGQPRWRTTRGSHRRSTISGGALAGRTR